MSKYRIWIDAGHGGNAPGAVYKDVQEKEIVLDVSMRLGSLLSTDFNVIYSRSEDSSLSIDERWKAANLANMDYFISIHANAGGGTGVETFYYKDNTERSRRSEVFARTLNDSYAEIMGLRNRGVKPDTQTAVGSIGVLRKTNMPAILVELAFIDSPPQNPDVNILQNKRAEMAQALAKGIYKYLGMEPSLPASQAESLIRVQLGAFKQRANADALQLRLRELGYDTFIKEDSALYRVQLGAFRERANAEALAAKLKAQGFETYITT